MFKIDVFCPTGHWVSINANQSTKLIKILEQACLRKQLGNADDYDLKHGRKILDLSNSVISASLPNLAKLEIVQAAKPRQNSDVLVIVQVTETNQRLSIQSFKCDTTLYQILQLYEEKEGLKLLKHSGKNFHPVIQYLKDEFIGAYALQSCTLRSLGLFSGRISFRHMFREITEAKLEQIAQSINEEKQMIDKIISKNPNTVSPAACMGNNFEERINDSDDYENDRSEQMKDSKSRRRSEEPGEMEADQASSTACSSSETSTSGSYHQISNSSSSANNSQHLHSNNENEINSLPNRPFANFKFPTETKGKNVYQNELSRETTEDIVPCERDIFVFQQNEEEQIQSALHDISDVPDEFFEHTINDLQVINRDLKQNLEQLCEEALTTNEMRRMQMERKMARYSIAVVRINFPDRYVVQANFLPLEKVLAIYKFVSDLLEEPYLEFELYTSPPKIVLDRTKTLFNANLVPLSLVYCSCVNSTKGIFLSNETKKMLSSKNEADIASTQAVSNVTSSENVATNSQAESFLPSNKTLSSKASDGAAPKWFNVKGKKK